MKRSEGTICWTRDENCYVLYSIAHRKKELGSIMKAINFLILSALTITIIGCDLLFGSNPEEPLPRNILRRQDSVAVRHLLDTNGLDSVKVMDVIDLKYSTVLSINLDSMGLKSFILDRWFDSIASAPGISLQYNSIDTLIFADSLVNWVGLSLGRNLLREVPPTISLLRGPVAIDVSYNQLVSMPLSIMGCNIKSLNFRYNNLCSIPDTMSKWLTQVDAAWRSYQTCP